MTQQRAGFARTDDGLQLYWRAVGEGPPIICCNGVGVSTFFWKYIAEYFQDTHTVVLWDYRGHGRSSLPKSPETADLSIEVNAQDLAIIRKAAGITEPAVLVVSKLSSMGGRQGARMLLPLYASPIAFALGRYTGVVDKHYAQKIDIDRYLEHLGHMDQRVFMRMVDLIADHDLEEHLPNIDVPTLVIAGEKDLFTPLHRSERMVELIPNAETRFLHERLARFPDLNQR